MCNTNRVILPAGPYYQRRCYRRQFYMFHYFHLQGMIQGRINKELKEFCLLDQVYVKAEDGKQSVAQYVAAVAKANNADPIQRRFCIGQMQPEDCRLKQYNV